MNMIKRTFNLVLVIAVLLFSACNVAIKHDSVANQEAVENSNGQQENFAQNFAFEHQNIRAAVASKSTEPAVLEPSEFEVELQEKEAISETLRAKIPASMLPKKCDILLAFDLTGSMGGAVTNATNNAQNIMNNIRIAIYDSYFGLVSHKDYPISPYGGAGDYAYKLHVPVSNNDSLIQEEMKKFGIGGGNNTPESYTRVLYESYSDSEIAWRNGAKKFVVFWLDATPHEIDPGRDGIPGTPDDLKIADVLAEMKKNNITLITLCSNSGVLQTWKDYSAKTGGDAFLLNTSNNSVANLIATSVTEQIKSIGKLSLEVHEPEFATWLTSVSPSQYTGINLDSEKSFDFTPTFTVPAGTPDGEYVFYLDLMGDGAIYANHKVTIKVRNNQPPIANAGEDITVEQLSPEGSTVTLSGAASFDPEDDELTYRWSWNVNGEQRFADGMELTAVFPAGTTEVTLTVTEKLLGKSATDTVLVTVQDTTPPEIISVERSQYWWVWDIFDNRYIYVCKVLAKDSASIPKITVSTIQVFRNGQSQTGKCYVKDNGEVYIQLPKDGKSRARNFYVTLSVTDASGNTVTHEEVFKRF